MSLEHIKDTICPICASPTEEERMDCLHSNGHWNEYRIFTCGLILHFTPNFMRVQREGACIQSYEYKQNVARNLAAKQKLVVFIDGLDADEKFKNDILDNIQHI